MVYVPKGEFEMGSTEVYPDEQPVHTVALDGFWIDTTEVTNAQYSLWVETGECELPPRVSRDGHYGNSAYDDYPVNPVSWHHALDYCSWAGARLPTEAEWEYAARGPGSLKFPWGDDFDGTRLNYCDASCLFNDIYGEPDDGYEETAPVGSYQGGASWSGALDMAGNAWEWVADWYAEDYYGGSPHSNPPGPSAGSYKVLRGGSWDGRAPEHARGAFRYWRNPDATFGDALGFRCARSGD